jgi:hypothetical protein
MGRGQERKLATLANRSDDLGDLLRCMEIAAGLLDDPRTVRHVLVYDAFATAFLAALRHDDVSPAVASLLLDVYSDFRAVALGESAASKDQVLQRIQAIRRRLRLA